MQPQSQSYPKRSRVKKALYFGSKHLLGLTGHIPSPWKTGHEVDGKPVLLIHNPKAAGSSLKALVGARGTTHSMPRLILSERAWRAHFIILSVRHPFDRFLSGYSFFVGGKHTGTLWRAHGAALRQMDPFAFLEFIKQYPEKLGPQVNWGLYPSAAKPRADLILKVEESANWPEQLRQAGLTVSGAEVPQLNNSRPAGHLADGVLGLAPEETQRLKTRVETYFAADYESFGYRP